MSDLWVFGYGSLMWRPGFRFLESTLALLEGYHRSFCVYSRYWRGTPERPGLALGLTGGGECRGTAFRVAARDREEVMDYLNERELGGYAYKAHYLPIILEDDRVIEALCFVADCDHCHYAGALPIDEAAGIIMDAEGVAGLNRDYLINTVRELESQGFGDAELLTLLRRVERLTGEIESGSGI